MSTKVEQAPAVELPRSKMSEVVSSSATSTSTPKVSLFAAKSGFVIPKNKLSGSLVPIFQRNKKLTGSDAPKEESSGQVLRKTKWGPDLTQDAAVRRGRALALQTRVDQITQQLGSGILEYSETVDTSMSAPEQLEEKSSNKELEREKSKQLELEKREAIGEILKLNANYKAPPDYKPLLREDRVSIPVKEFPGYNFVGLIFGPGGDNRKRLEKETGAKMQVYGTKTGKDKPEIIPLDGNDFQGSYEDIYIHISADSYDKVDAAVSVIEPLVTSVSGNLATAAALSTATDANNKNIPVEKHTSIPTLAPHGGEGSFMGSSQAPSEGQFQFSSPWSSVPSPSIFAPNYSAPVNNLSHQPAPPSNHPLPFGSRPAVAGQNLLPPSQSQSQFMQNHYMNQLHPSDIRTPQGNHVFPVLHPPTAPFPSVSRPPMSQGHTPMLSQPNTTTGSISKTPMVNMNLPPLTFASGSSPLIPPNGQLNRPVPVNFPSSVHSAPQAMPVNNGPHGMPIPRGNPLNSSLGPETLQHPPRRPLHPFESGPVPNFSAMRPSAAGPQNPNFSEFTFHPHHRPQMPRFMPPNAAEQGPFRPLPHPDFHPRQEHFPVPPVRERFPFPNMGPGIGDMNYGLPRRSQHLGPAQFSPGLGNMMEPRGRFRPPMNMGDILPPPLQQFGHNRPLVRPGPGMREPQIYDPFSPTSASNRPQRQGDNSSSGKRRVNDPEYEDLMASVGVK